MPRLEHGCVSRLEHSYVSKLDMVVCPSDLVFQEILKVYRIKLSKLDETLTLFSIIKSLIVLPLILINYSCILNSFIIVYVQ